MSLPAGFIVGAPFHALRVECHQPNGPGWTDGYPGNVVVNQGKGDLLNRFFGGITKSTVGAFIPLHSATTASNDVWSNISASQVASYGNNLPFVTFATTYTAGLATQTFSYAFNAGTQTLSGAAVLMYTTNTCSTNAATSDIRLYAEGQFAASRIVQNGDSLSCTVSVSYA